MGCADAVVIAILATIIFIYDILTYPIYYIVQQPWKTIQASKNPKEAKTTIISREGGLTYRCKRTKSKATEELEKNKVDTLDKVFKYAVKRNGNKKCLGTREIIDEEDEIQSSGKVFKKYVLGDYIWKTYNEIEKISDMFSRGLRSLGMEPRDRICIFGETRPEWLISAMAAFNQSIGIVTLYATLGDDAVVHGLNETEVEFVITSHDLMPKFRNILKECPKVKYLIYMEDPLKKTDISGFPENVSISSFCEIISLGSRSSVGACPPTPDDIAIIMYTSGSTGTPKGVLMSHKNITAGMLGFADAVSPVYSWDCYLAYLPLAHVLELMAESYYFMSGIPIGYSSALTMTDTSGKIKRGGKGDATVLRPTTMTVVPLIVDRIYKGIQEKVAAGSPVAQAVFKYFYDYKLKWYYRGFRTPIADSLIFKRTKQLVGGNVRFFAAGGAPLSPDAQEFVRNCLCAPIMQGYGLTETGACGTVTLFGDMTTGRVGQAHGACDLKFVNWEEGNYKVSDKPYPRGEILIGGDIVAQGYYKLPDATAADFFEENGKRWFRTGDIGVMESDFVVKIIDRKKDLVKLQSGEYISLGKVESELKTCNFVDNLCVYGDPMKAFCVALVVPALAQIEALATKLGKTGQSLEQICEDPDVIKAVLKELQAHGQKAKLLKFEIPMALKLCPEPWTPDSGLVTAAFKLKRKPIQDQFQKDINRLYAAA